MATLIHLDTHVVAWLFAGRTELLSPVVRVLIDEHDLRISPMVVLELQYLYEVKRATQPAATVVQTLQDDIGLGVCKLPFERVIDLALGLSWTRDPFDRVIVAQAELAGVLLVTKDEHIREHFPRAIWDPPVAPRI